ncbi:TetR/AcrR family transcriptional regulator [Burkholderia sp. Ac-20379]|uniref:TetR/AcrR family transcriptional regulator n=1 Tax=Burkholderia sp. Ac-20379 TaxID=2703900 RepID=UPI0019824D88|nr:TetR/AcrR family transcriptional regulator [Burkholderia sp. Ac-20379]MBN3728374.1 TetR/AcrR family transcriptional regulator [Burkholderia sp. Ac-20379]
MSEAPRGRKAKADTAAEIEAGQDAPPARRQRSDAANNRDRLLASAHSVFAERGLAATLDDVARHAGVGVATAYRHFPNKMALASEVLEGAIAQLAADAEAALALADPWQSFSSFFETVVSAQSRHRGLHHLSAADGIVGAEIQQRFEMAVKALFERAQREGVVRADARPTDIGPLLVMLRTVIDLSPPGKPELWRRYLAFLLDGLRAAGQPPAPVDGLTPAELDAFIAMKARA